jgi:hypothetical protein
MIQGYKITTFDVLGTLFVIAALIRNNVCQRKEENINKQILQEEQLRQAV